MQALIDNIEKYKKKGELLNAEERVSFALGWFKGTCGRGGDATYHPEDVLALLKALDGQD